MQDSKRPETLVEYLRTLRQKGIPENEYEKYMSDYLEFSARDRAIPLHGTFELTPLCNLNCKMCYVHLENSQFTPDRLLSISTWKTIIEGAYNAGMRKASLTGGECLTYPGFEDVYFFLQEKGIPIGIMTNGILLDSRKVDFFIKNPPKGIQVTLYGSNDNIYERVTGKRVFNIVFSNIQNVRDAGIPVKIAITPSRFMQDDLENVLEVAEKLKVPYYINSFLSAPRANTGRKKEDMSIDHYIAIYKKRRSLHHLDDSKLIDPAELPEPGHGLSKRYGLKCGAGRSSFVAKYDGTISPCCSLYNIEADPMEDGFQAAWEKINKAAESYVLPVECGSCFYESVCPRCAAMHRDAPLKGHCDPFVCERTKKFISAGLIQLPK